MRALAWSSIVLISGCYASHGTHRDSMSGPPPLDDAGAFHNIDSGQPDAGGPCNLAFHDWGREDWRAPRPWDRFAVSLSGAWVALGEGTENLMIAELDVDESGIVVRDPFEVAGTEGALPAAIDGDGHRFALMTQAYARAEPRIWYIDRDAGTIAHAPLGISAGASGFAAGLLGDRAVFAAVDSDQVGMVEHLRCAARSALEQRRHAGRFDRRGA